MLSLRLLKEKNAGTHHPSVQHASSETSQHHEQAPQRTLPGILPDIPPENNGRPVRQAVINGRVAEMARNLVM